MANANETGKTVKVTSGFSCVAGWGNWNGCGKIHGDHREAMLCGFKRDLDLVGNPHDDRWDYGIVRATLIDDGVAPVILVDRSSMYDCATPTGQWLRQRNLCFVFEGDESAEVSTYVTNHIIACLEEDLEARPPVKAVTIEMVATPLAAAMRQVMPQSMAPAFPEPKPAEEAVPAAEATPTAPARRSAPKARRTARAA